MQPQPFSEFFRAPLLWLLIATLSVWRLTSIIHTERIARVVRKLFGVDETGELWIYPDTFFGYLISCFWCLSIWVGLAVAVLLILLPYVLLPFALSGGAILINRLLGDKDA